MQPVEYAPLHVSTDPAGPCLALRPSPTTAEAPPRRNGAGGGEGFRGSVGVRMGIHPHFLKPGQSSKGLAGLHAHNLEDGSK
jgi:hypothetical protein